MICRILLLVSIYILVSCTSNKNRDVPIAGTKQIAEIIINPDLIDSFYTNDYCDSLIKAVELLRIEQLYISENNDSVKVELFQIPDWGDPGDFLKLRISDMSDNVIYEANDFNGWIRPRIPKELKSQSLVDSEYLIVLNGKYGKQLLLFGYTYASKPGYLTIIDIFPTPKVIFHKQYDLFSIKYNDLGDYNLIISWNSADSLTLDFDKMKINN